MENLNIKEMILDHDYSKGLHRASLGMLKNMIKYKCELYGKTFIEVPRYYASSQYCHVCGYKNTDLTIEERNWQCPHCGAILDRDLNAGATRKSLFPHLISEIVYFNPSCDGISPLETPN